MNLSFYKKADINSPEFKAWFGNSKVVDENGNPLVQYHYTNSPEIFDTFRTDDIEDFGAHFGTQEQANDVVHHVFDYVYNDLSKKKKEDIKSPAERIYPAYLSIHNPLRLPDRLTVQDVGKYLVDKKIITEQEFKNIRTKSPYINRKEWVKDLKALLINKGYDGIVYENTVEGIETKNKNKFNDSYIAFHPNQIKSQLGNSGKYNMNDSSIIASLKLAITMDKDKEKEKVLTLDNPLKSKNPDDLLNSMGLKLQHTGKYILDNYTNNTFFLPVVEFDADKQNLGRVAFYFGLPWDETKVQALGEPKVQFDATVGNELRSLGAILSDKLHEDFPMLEDVNLRFGWDIDNKFKLFAVKKKS